MTLFEHRLEIRALDLGPTRAAPTWRGGVGATTKIGTSDQGIGYGRH